MKNNSISCITNDFLIKNLKEIIHEKYGEIPPLAYIHSFGCQQNVCDGEKIKANLSNIGYFFTDNPEMANIIILNTCAVRENAEDRVFGILGEYKHIKEKSPDTVICVCGCMAQEEHVAKRIKETYKQVDLVFGTFVFHEFYQMLYDFFGNNKRIFNQSEEYEDINIYHEQLRDNKVKAAVPIMYGCNNFCTYCIVPYVRGRERSRKLEDIVTEVKSLVNSGYKEITLLGQNVNSYSYGFSKLLREINLIDGDFRVNFMSSHPKDATKELIDTILECDKIQNHLHLPVQSGNDRILKEMNRRYTVDKYLEIVDYARSQKSDFSFSTDIIVGFPTETYEEFCDTKSLLKRVKFDNVYSFVYSKRSGTKAALIEDNISEKQKGLWLRELILEQRETAQNWLARFIGKTVRVLVDNDRKEDGLFRGKCDENIIVEFEGDASLVGTFQNVKIIKSMNWAMLGEIV